MKRRGGLRGRIVLIAVFAPLTLGLTAFLTVHRNVRQHVDSSSIHASLDDAVSVLEGMLAARGRVLAGGGEVIARDPRFFSMLMLGRDQRDDRFVATLRGMARDLNAITRCELFQVLDRRGRTLASVGETHASRRDRDSLVRRALRGRAVGGVIAVGRTLHQVSATPMRGDGRIIGVLLLGSAIDQALARELRAEMRSEVSFLVGGEIASSTLDHEEDRLALQKAVPAPPARAVPGKLKVKGRGLTWITVMDHLPGSDPSAGHLYVMQRAYDPETQFLHRMERDMLVLVAVAVMAAWVTGLMLVRRITGPIQQLVRGALEMQRGNYVHPVEVRNRDEIGYLADRFLEMRRREQTYVSGLEEAATLKSRFISVVSHELRTPISAIQGYRDLLEAGDLGRLSKPQRGAIQAMQAHLQRLTRIAEQAVQMASVQGERLELAFARQNLGPIVEHAISAASAMTARKVEIRRIIEISLEPANVDGEMLGQALSNLISNAIRFTPEGGIVDVHARSLGDRTAIEISDQGPGIPEGDLDELFNHGFAAKDPRYHHSSSDLAFGSRGLGFGLGIARAIVEAHGGRISARNRPEGGSTFWVELPRSGAQADLAA